MKKIIIAIIILTLLVVTLKVHRVVAEEVGNVLGVMKEKLGFEIRDSGSDFIFSKITPNYVAYAGDQSSLGGHKVRLERDGAVLDLSFVSAENENSSPTEIPILLTSQQEQILDQAEQILGLSAVSPEDQLIVDAAREILAGFSPQPLASDNFLFLVQLKSFKIKRLSLDVDLKLAEISRDISTVMSKATLVEEENERVVTFTDSALGLTMDYRLREEGIRQEIIINQKENTHSKFMFALTTHGLQYKNVGNGVWYFSDGAGPILRLPKGYAVDANGVLQNDVQAKIEKKDGIDTLTIHIPESWLLAPDRMYPVRIFTGIEVVPELRQGGQPLRVPTIIIPTQMPSLISSPPGEATPSATLVPTITPTIMITITPTEQATESAIL